MLFFFLLQVLSILADDIDRTLGLVGVESVTDIAHAGVVVPRPIPASPF